MAKMLVDECPAGAAMDAAVAEALGYKVDWQLWPARPSYLGTYIDEYDGGWAEHEDWRPVLPYSTHLGAAETLWDKLAENHWVVSVCYGPGRDGRGYASVQMQLDMFLGFDLAMRNPTDMDAKAETKALAICRAFLKANGMEYVEVLE